MERQLFYLFFICFLLGNSFSKGQGHPSIDSSETDSVVILDPIVAEAEDFATRTFGDAWDMSDFSDVSQDLNNGGRNVSLADTRVEGGLFYGRSLRDYKYSGPAVFYPLARGDKTAIILSAHKNIGIYDPIDPTAYSCLYVAMRVSSPAPNLLPDHMLVGWDVYEDDGTILSGNTYQYLYPEAGSGTPVVNWKLYKVDLNDSSKYYPGSISWQGLPSWQVLRIHPTVYPTNFIIDWVRLTNCQNSAEYQTHITWTPNSNVEAIWAQPLGEDRSIQLVAGVNGDSGSYVLDTKGFTPGIYRIGVGGLTTCCSQWSTNYLTINKSPLAKFLRPSPTTGEDYATLSGNPWDIRSDDIISIECTNYAFYDHLLILDTPPPAQMGSRCKAGGIVDSKIFLELPGELSNAGQYRYLSFAHYIRGDYVLPADGMMGRFIWTTADNCTFVSNDIPYDVGQRDYFIDLFDTFNGTPEISAPTSCRLRPWWQAGRVIQIRFDPNENYTGTYVPAMTFHQEIDWFRLTKVDQVVRGAYFRIDLQLNKPVSSLQSIHYYYTNDLGNPTQHPVVQYNPPTQQPPSGSIKTYLPLTVSGGSFSWYYTSSYWNTTGVVPGEYYLCAVISDGLNESTSCSYAPVQVLS